MIDTSSVNNKECSMEKPVNGLVTILSQYLALDYECHY